MKQLYTILILCLLVVVSLKGQQRGTPDSLLTGVRISTNLLTLREPDGGISLALENRYTKEWSVLVEGTWIFIDEKSDFGLRGQYTPKAKGFRIRPEIRYYMPGRGHKYKLFFAQEISYKRVSYLEEWIHREGENPNNGTFNYEKITPYDKVKTIIGTSGKMGLQFYFDPRHKFIMELYVGLGIKHRKIKFKDEVPIYGSYLEDNDGYFFDTLESGWNINIPMGLKVGYRF
ncbi:DUF3575 domain-containing protein [Chitinophaga sp. S165]|uniref:DUF3575 domain-containing protein n=1 Tax=Chitinophaga sp. S165 TaxID=2135462 RepID=UPI000D70A146|nr:DUF3575 domain-containing protein [Chitinophaga sp. S165]PWV49739.1 uncharacterized protein DUF3575 [Chitinophaga sp. S165]